MQTSAHTSAMLPHQHGHYSTSAGGPSNGAHHISTGWDWVTSVNASPYFAAVLVLIINMGGRYLAMDLSRAQERVFAHPITRRIILFAVLFLATRNILLSFVLTVAISVVLFNLLHEDSMFYCLPGFGTVEKPPVLLESPMHRLREATTTVMGLLA